MTINAIEQCYQELKRAGKNPARLFSGNPADFGITFPVDQLRSIYSRAIDTHYQPDSHGWIGAREAISQYYATRGATVSPDQITLTSGTSESFRYLCDLLAKPGDHILLPSPGYPLFSEIAKLSHLTCDYYRLTASDRWAIDITSLEAAIKPQTKAIVLVSPHNPTGMVANRDELRAVVDIANYYHIPVIVDEVFSEFYYGRDSYPRLISETTPHLSFTMNGISKLLALPGLKLGWIVTSGSEASVNDHHQRLGFMADLFLSTHAPIQHALPDLLAEGLSFTTHYANQLATHRAALLETLDTHPHLSVIAPEGGFYAMIRAMQTPWQTEDEMIITIMRRDNLFFHPGYFYDYDKGLHLVTTLLSETLAPTLQSIECGR